MKTKIWIFRVPLLILLSIGSYFYSDTRIWILFLILSIFYVVIDYFKADRRVNEVAGDYVGAKGVLGEYLVDGDKSYGLFIDLLGTLIFVDIKTDSLIEDRKRRALYIFENSNLFDESLRRFLDVNIEYQSKQLLYIGLHSKDILRGEVFWEPNGYTLLLGDDFVLDEAKKGE